MTEYSVLFVCTANRCRSPMAEGIWRKHLREQGELERWAIGSAGTWTADGLPVMPLTEQVFSRRGIHMFRHTSRIVDRLLMDSYALILVMEHGHKEALQTEFSDRRNHIFLLSEMITQHFDIQDPVAGTLQDYENTATEIERLLLAGEQRIRSLAWQDKS